MIDYEASESIQGESSSSSTSVPSSSGLLIGRIITLQENGNPLVAFDAETKNKPIEAFTVVPLVSSSVGKDVAISFAQNQGGMPIVMGVIRRMLDEVLDDAPKESDQKALNAGIVKPEVIVDGNKLELSAPEEVTIRCGEASITLNKSGKILIKGEHMLNRISGAYKVKSGSIELN